MRRREFITLLGGAAAAWPLAAHAQQARTVVRIGVLGPNLSTPFASTLYQAFLAQLRELGFNEGQNLIAEYQAMDDARETARVHRAVLLGLVGSILGWADRKGDQWLCRRGDLVSQRRK